MLFDEADEPAAEEDRGQRTSEGTTIALSAAPCPSRRRSRTSKASALTVAMAMSTSFHWKTGKPMYSSGRTEKRAKPGEQGDDEGADRDGPEVAQHHRRGHHAPEAEDAEIHQRRAGDERADGEDVEGVDDGIEIERRAHQRCGRARFQRFKQLDQISFARSG